MKIRIRSEPYINQPAPKLTKKLFDWFWKTFWNLHTNYYEIYHLDTIDIRINQALPYSPIHFYITINNEFEFHKEWDRYDKYTAYDGESRKQSFNRMVRSVKRNFDSLSQAEKRSIIINRVLK